MIFYNWKQVLHYSKKSSKEIISIIDYITYRPTPKYLGDAAVRYANVDWKGNSFLLNPIGLLRHRYSDRNSDLEIAHYIGLASLRSYPEYETVGTLSLDLLACQGKENIINNNSLLYIEDDRVHFRYEEATRSNT